MTDRNFYSLSNFDFLARSFAHMESEGLTVDLHAVTGNMNEEQRLWFYQRYEHYRQQAHAREKESQEK